MKRTVIVRPEAESDLQMAFGWYEERVEGLGRAFVRNIDSVLSSIVRSPDTYPRIHKQIRRALVRRFPFGIFYIFNDEKITVLAVMHVKRHPLHWQVRKH